MWSQLIPRHSNTCLLGPSKDFMAGIWMCRVDALKHRLNWWKLKNLKYHIVLAYIGNLMCRHGTPSFCLSSRCPSPPGNCATSGHEGSWTRSVLNIFKYTCYIYMIYIYIYITRKFACLRCSHPGPLDDHSSFNAAVDWLWPVKRTWPWRTRFRKLWMLVRGWRVGLRQPVLAVRPSCIPSSLRFQCLGGINHTVFFTIQSHHIIESGHHNSGTSSKNLWCNSSPCRMLYGWYLGWGRSLVNASHLINNIYTHVYILYKPVWGTC